MLTGEKENDNVFTDKEIFLNNASKIRFIRKDTAAFITAIASAAFLVENVFIIRASQKYHESLYKNIMRAFSANYNKITELVTCIKKKESAIWQR